MYLSLHPLAIFTFARFFLTTMKLCYNRLYPFVYMAAAFTTLLLRGYTATGLSSAEGLLSFQMDLSVSYY